MFYCEGCAIENSWPRYPCQVLSSRGSCEICGFWKDCYDVPSSYLSLLSPVVSTPIIPAATISANDMTEAALDAADDIPVCPLCNQPDADKSDWPMKLPDGSTAEGGCQMCWEKQCSESWWETHGGVYAPVDTDKIRASNLAAFKELQSVEEIVLRMTWKRLGTDKIHAAIRYLEDERDGWTDER